MFRTQLSTTRSECRVTFETTFRKSKRKQRTEIRRLLLARKQTNTQEEESDQMNEHPQQQQNIPIPVEPTLADKQREVDLLTNYVRFTRNTLHMTLAANVVMMILVLVFLIIFVVMRIVYKPGSKWSLWITLVLFCLSLVILPISIRR